MISFSLFSTLSSYTYMRLQNYQQYSINKLYKENIPSISTIRGSDSDVSLRVIESIL